jgi:hypothetical protein
VEKPDLGKRGLDRVFFDGRFLCDTGPIVPRGAQAQMAYAHASSASDDTEELVASEPAARATQYGLCPT